jgi:hypothetical protein
MARESERTTFVAGEGADSSELSAQTGKEGFDLGSAPIKVVTGHQTTSNLSFDLKPGAIIAHPRSRVIFVCG